MIVGYARVSTIDQTPQLQIDALKAAKCKPIYVKQKSGKNMNRPELTRCLDMLRKGDILVIWKLDRLGRSLVCVRTKLVSQLLSTCPLMHLDGDL